MVHTLNHNSAFKSIPRSDNVFTIALDRAVELLAQGKTQTALKVLGKHPQDSEEVAIYDGRFGAYVQHGKIRATLPKGDTVDEITLERGTDCSESRQGRQPEKTVWPQGCRQTRSNKSCA